MVRIPRSGSLRIRDQPNWGDMPKSSSPPTPMRCRVAPSARTVRARLSVWARLRVHTRGPSTSSLAPSRSGAASYQSGPCAASTKRWRAVGMSSAALLAHFASALARSIGSQWWVSSWASVASARKQRLVESRPPDRSAPMTSWPAARTATEATRASRMVSAALAIGTSGSGGVHQETSRASPSGRTSSQQPKPREWTPVHTCRPARGQGTGSSSWRARVSSSRLVSMRAVRPLGLSAATVTPPIRAWKTCRAVEREPWVRVRPSNEAAR
jgi:hypothetical protein